MIGVGVGLTVVVLKKGPNSEQINLLDQTSTPVEEVLDPEDGEVEEQPDLDEVIIDDSERTCDLDNLQCPNDLVWKKHEGSCMCHCIIECPSPTIRDLDFCSCTVSTATIASDVGDIIQDLIDGAEILAVSSTAMLSSILFIL